jgi:alpha-mannosidase
VVEIENDRVLATALKRSEDGQAWILRLFGAGGTTEQVRLNWKDNRARQVTVSDLGERPGTPVAGAVTVPAWGVVTLRAE